MTTSAKMNITEKEMSLNSLRMFANQMPELHKISRALHKNDENDCNFACSPRRDRKEARLMKRADEIANLFDLVAYHQSDQRGCALYLIKKGETEYTNGIAII